MKRTNNIEANSVTIKDYLKNSKKIIIPRYQREYSWDKGNIFTLINDLNEYYYIGNIIEYDEKNNNEKEIVDGQQRTITIFLILIALMYSVDEETIKKDIGNLIKDDEGKCKLVLMHRIGSDGRDILDFLIENAKVPADLSKKYNELSMYNKIKKEILGYSEDKKIGLFNRLMGSSLVEICFKNNEMSAHEMFVNLNTKGKPLEMIEVLKSQLFKFLLQEGVTDSCKEKWQKMLEIIPKSDYETYCSDVFLFDSFKEGKPSDDVKTSGTLRENSLGLINSIFCKEKAEEIFDFMTGYEKGNMMLVYSAIKTHNLNQLKGNYYSGCDSVSFDSIDSIWKLFEELKFKQSDIMFVSVLFDKEDFIKNNINLLCVFMKYILMYEVYRSLMKISPANYANSFKQVANVLFKTKDTNQIKTTLKDFIEDMRIDEKAFKDALKNEKTFSKNYKTAKFIIMLAENIYTSGLKVEHFIPKKTQNSSDIDLINRIGNLIPVVQDKYKDNNITRKIEMYELDRGADKGIDNFLKYGVTESNYFEIIQKRENDITSGFIEKMNNYYNRIMRG